MSNIEKYVMIAILGFTVAMLLSEVFDSSPKTLNRVQLDACKDSCGEVGVKVVTPYECRCNEVPTLIDVE